MAAAELGYLLIKLSFRIVYDMIYCLLPVDPSVTQSLPEETENPSWAPMRNGLHSCEFVFHRNHSPSLLIS